MCLECYLHLSGREAGGQEVRQELDHLYHVLCMTSGPRLNIYMCLKVMQMEKEVRRTLIPLSICKKCGVMQLQI